MLALAPWRRNVRGDSGQSVTLSPSIGNVSGSGVDLTIEDFDEISRRTPLIANMRPTGKYQMEDLFYAGGIPAVLKQLLSLLHRDALTVTGRSLAENVQGAQIFNSDVIRTLENPLQPEGGLAVVWGNLAPDGAVIKHAAASPHLLQHRGKAIVFRDIENLNARLNDPGLAVTEDSILVLQNVGPVGGQGMPEVGNFPIPEKLLKRGVRDMIRISDARMCGTAFGAIVLHVSPESAIGGPLSLVQEGDEIELEVAQPRLHLNVDDAELSRRRAKWRSSALSYNRGYGRLYLEHVNQAPLGCDFDFLRGSDPVSATEQPKF